MASPTEYPVPCDRTPAAQAQREAHWRQVVERCRKSGLTRSAFCQREGINGNALTWWVRVLRERDGTGGPAAVPKSKHRHRPHSNFVPVRLVPAAPASGAGFIDVVARGGRVVRVQPGFDAAFLQRVVAALEGLPC